MRRSRKNGFTLTETVLALMVTGIIALCVGMLIESCVQALRIRDDSQNGLGMLQLRERLATGSSTACENGTLQVVRNHELYEYVFDVGRIVQRPGYEILLEGLEKGEFECTEGEVWLDTGQRSWQVK